MKLLDLTIPLGIATPPWPTYEPLQVKYFKRLAPNGANGQLVTHSKTKNLLYPVDARDYDVYTSKMVEDRVEVKEGDILIIHTGYHHFGWDQPYADEIRYMVCHPGPDREFSEWMVKKKIRWFAVDCGSADHPMNTIVRTWMPRQAKIAEKVFLKKYKKPLEEYFDDSKYQLMHIELFNRGIIHCECFGGDIDLLLNKRVQVGFFPWRFVDGESCIGRAVAFLEDAEYEKLMAEKAKLPKTRFGDCYNPKHMESINKISEKNLA